MLNSVLKSRDITLPTKVHLVKPMVFPVVMYGCESWTIKQTKCWKTDAFKLWCWRRLLRVPWTARKSNQSILKETDHQYSLEGLMLKLQNFWPPDARSRLTGKDPDVGQDWGQEEGGGSSRDDWMASLTQRTWVWANSRRKQRTGKPGGLQSMGSQRIRHNLTTEQYLQ